MTSEYEYTWTEGPIVNDETLDQMAHLYSNHYGFWSKDSGKPAGTRVRLSRNQLRGYTSPVGASIALAKFNSEIIGYAVVLRKKIPHKGEVSWVTQFVVHEKHRNKKIGRMLLFSSWSMTDHYAWGILTANPYAVRALEAATRRRCQPQMIQDRFKTLLEACAVGVPYVLSTSESRITSSNAQINTDFHLCHKHLNKMIKDVTENNKEWTLGELGEKWEWIAFTFRAQQQQSLSSEEIEEMLKVSDQITQQAYRKMRPSASQKWMQHTPYETNFITKQLQRPGVKSVVDFGCGSGRHCALLAKLGLLVHGIDYIDVRNDTHKDSFGFTLGDCRTVDLTKTFDAGICLYDVVGSYADDVPNLAILQNLRKHLKDGAPCLISVMNLEYTMRIAKHWFRLEKNSDCLLDLKPSNIMETTGDVFDPNHYLIDESTTIVYRKEQFSEGNQLPAELIVRDRRYNKQTISKLCQDAGFSIIWLRKVRAGAWDVDDPINGKELLILCEAVKPTQSQFKLV